MSLDSSKNIERYELSENQKNLFLIAEKDLKSYHNQVLLDINVDISFNKLSKIIEEITENDEVFSLKLSYDTNYNLPFQCLNFKKNNFKVIELNNSDVESLVNNHFDDNYDPVNDNSSQFIFVLDNDKLKYLAVRIYSLWSDSWSCIQIVDQILNLISNQNHNNDDKALIEYTNFSAWQNDLIENAEQEAISFWRDKKINNNKPILPFINIDHQTLKPIRKKLFTLKGQDYKNITATDNQGSYNLHDLILHRFVNYLFSFTEDPIAIGYLPYKRNYNELEKTLGLVNKTIPLIIENTKKMNTSDAIIYLENQLKEAIDWYDYYTINRYDKKNIEDTITNFCFEYIDLKDINNYPILKVKDFYTIQDFSHLKFCFVNYGDELSVEVYYNENTIDPIQFEIIKGQFKKYLLNEKVDFELTPIEKEIIQKSNTTNKDLPEFTSVVEMFENNVEVNPNAIAIVSNQRQTTYIELNQKANQFKEYLINECNVKPGDSVCFFGSASENFIISVLGILKTGAHFIPIDINYPQKRIKFILNESKSKVLINDQILNNDSIDFDKKIKIITVDEKLFDNKNNIVSKSKISNRLPAYCIYTSGSTGNPKGCLIRHSNLLNYIHWANEFYFRNQDIGNWMLLTSISFDLTITSVFTSLTRGKKLTIGDPKKEINVLLEEAFSSKDVDVLKLTPAHITLLKDFEIKTSNIRKIICGGEQLLNNHISILKNISSEIEIYNEYGPTETTVGCITYKINSLKDKVLIGKPIANTQIQILNENLLPCPIGVSGELFIAGAGVGLGYLNREDLTQERFLKLPYFDGLFYKSGDNARWLSDGNIECLGRNDDQVKLNGYRIELEEIVNHLSDHKDIENATVLIKEFENQTKELVAFIVSKKKLDDKTLIDYLANRIPSYMVPRYYFQLDRIPLTQNGKIDSKALLGIQFNDIQKQIEVLPPRDNFEKAIIKIWQEILQVDEIGINSSFFILGGHSIKATRLINEYQRLFNVSIILRDIFENSILEDHARLIKEAAKNDFLKIEPAPTEQSYPLSFSQNRLWVLSKFKEASSAYNIPNTSLIKDCDINALIKSIRAIIDRHEILRTVFKEDENSTIRQFVLQQSELDFNFKHEDIREIKEQDEYINNTINQDLFKGFDFEKGPLLRGILFQKTNSEVLFYYNMHHIISDGWSMNVIEKDILAYYNHFKNQTSIELPELTIQYKDYSVWEQNKFLKSGYIKQLDYWINRLNNQNSFVSLPSSKTRPVVLTYNGRSYSTHLSKEIVKGINKFVENYGGSSFMFLIASWNLFFHKYNSSIDITIGTTVSGRNHYDLHNQIGFYVNTIPLRNFIDSQRNLIEFYHEVKNNTLNDFENQDIPFDLLVNELSIDRDTSRSPVFNVMLVMQNNESETDEIKIDDHEIDLIIDKGAYMAKYELSLIYKEVNDYMMFNVNYNEDVYDPENIIDVISNYKHFLSQLINNIDSPIKELPYFDASQVEMIINKNNSNFINRNDNTLIKLFEEQVLKSSDKKAIVFRDEVLTFKELDEVTDKLCAILIQKYNIKKGEVVGVHLGRSQWSVVSFLAILKTGGVYLPIDIEMPTARKQFICKDSHLKLLIVDGLTEEEKESYQVNLFDIRENFILNEERITCIKPKIVKNDLAYIIYTSGSTGTPKGVMIEQEGIVNTILSQIEIFDFNAYNNLLQFASFSFDASISETLMSILSGKTLHVLDDETRKNPVLFEQYVQKNNIEVATLPPAFFNLLDIQKIQNIKVLITAGESANFSKSIEYLKNGVFYNAYGPTETSICATIFKLENKDDLPSLIIPIGKPIPNTSIFILNENNEILPFDVPGEICIGGVGLARGYVNQKKMTAEKFVENPLVLGQRLYKTGDVGKLLRTGNIEYLSRLDNQIKVRGNRVEIKEIEYAINSIKFVKNSAVLYHEDELFVFIVSDKKLSAEKIRASLSKTIPSYMIPNFYYQVEQIPLTINGKVDKKLLLNDKKAQLNFEKTYEEPQNETQLKLVEIWSCFLKTDFKIGINDDFFQIGGDSIKGVKILVEIQKAFNITIDLSVLFHKTCIGELSNYIDELILLNEISLDNFNNEESDENLII